MLPKTERFTTKELDGLRKTNPKTKKLNTLYGFFVIYTEGGVAGKKGIALPKKIFKTAILRNKLKRLFYNTILEIKKEESKELKERVERGPKKDGGKEVGENKVGRISNASLVFHPKKVFTKEELKKDLVQII